MTPIWFRFSLCFAGLTSSWLSQAAVLPIDLKTESATHPVGLDTQQPRLSWRMQADHPGAAQSAYQIEVPGLWDSGKVMSDRSLAIPYSGPALKSVSSYQWRVRIWDEQGNPSAWSAPASWTTGLMRADDWQARWLSPPDAPAATAPPGPERLSVQKATYRTLDGSVSKDVTQTAREWLRTATSALQISPDALGGDPAVGTPKELLLEFTLDGKPGVTSARDFEALHIPRRPSGDLAYWFRRDVTLTAAPKSALFTIHSPAYVELHINGKKVGSDVLSPAVSDLQDRTFTLTYDVAPLLRAGKNTLGVWLGTGWASQKGFRAQLNAVVDGKPVVIGSDAEWLAKPSCYSKIGGQSWGDFGGERIDANFDQPDWSTPEASLQGWLPANVSDTPAAAGTAMHQIAPTNRIGAKIPAVRVTPLADGRYEIDFGTNLTGWLDLKLPHLAANQRVRLYFADRLFPDERHLTPIGELPVQKSQCVSFRRTDGGTNAYQHYNQVSEFISAGNPGERFRHQFNYAGFRYVVVDGLPQAPDAADATALLVESDLPSAASFECSDERINRIHRANVWTLRCLNLGGYAVDCPHRERMGYGDGQVFLEGMMTGFGASTFFEKWFGDWRNAQQPDGSSAYVAPAFTQGGGGPPWPGPIAEGPWQHYQHYGDPKILADGLDHALRYVKFLDAKAVNDVLRDWGGGLTFLGDWVPPGRGMDTGNFPSKEMAELFNNCYRILLWQWVGHSAAVLGRDAVVQESKSRVEAIRKATHAAFYDASNERYVIDEQIYYVMPLITGVTPPELQPKILANFLKCLTVKNQGKLDTGMIGTKYLIKFLDETDRDELILPFYQSPDYPGWGYMIEQGATTLWEQWNGFWSQIHSCFAQADNWLYRGLAGIRPDPAGPGFKQCIIQPSAPGDIRWVKAHHDSPYGRIGVHWQREGKAFQLDVEIPPNTRAMVILPGSTSGKSVGPGKHRFETTLPQ